MVDASIQVADELIEDMVRGQLMKELCDKPRFIQGLVSAVLNAKGKSDSWADRDKTIFQMMFEEMVKNTAKEVFTKWLEENNGAIRVALENHLTRHKSRAVKQIAEDITKGMSNYTVSVDFNLQDK